MALRHCCLSLPQRVYQCQSIGMAVFVFFYTALFVAMTVIFHMLIKGEAIMALQDVILLSILNFVGSMIPMRRGTVPC